MPSKSRSPPAGTGPSERSPLLGVEHQSEGPVLQDAHSEEQYPVLASGTSGRRRWHSIIALGILCTTCIAIIAIGFLAPAAGESYYTKAVVPEIKGLSVEKFVFDGVQVRVQAAVKIDASRVKDGNVRTFGRFSGWLIRRVHVSPSTVNLYLSDGEYRLLGKVQVPPVTVDIRDEQVTTVDLVATVQPGSTALLQELVGDFLKGKLQTINVEARAEGKVHAGIIPLGEQVVWQRLSFSDFPTVPSTNINGLDLSEITLDDGSKAVGVKVNVSFENSYPVSFDIPALDFIVSLPACGNDKAKVATAISSPLKVHPRSDINATISGVIKSIPKEMISVCPGSDTSPLDHFIGEYMHGKNATIYVSGGEQKVDPNVPTWMKELLMSTTLPVPFPGHTFDNLVRKFGLTDVEFELPDSMAEPGTPDAAPKLSAKVEAIVKVPKEMNFPINVEHLMADANVSYIGEKFGELHIKEWVNATSALTKEGDLRVEASVKKVPLDITDYDVFQKVIQKMLWGGKVKLGIAGTTDVKLSTSVGDLVLRGIPASGVIDINGLPNISEFEPKANHLAILETTETSIKMSVELSVNNPTPYSALVPYVSIEIGYENYRLGNASVSNLQFVKGENNFTVHATWEPWTEDARNAGRALLSDYISGKNTTITLSPHKHSIPSLPDLGRALSGLHLHIPTPRLNRPNGAPTRFLEGAVLHLLSSSAVFTLFTPIQHAITLHQFNGSAYYNGSLLGTIDYPETMVIPAGPGEYLTERIPVDWELDGIGYEAVEKALGGQLKIKAVADAEVGIGKWKIGWVRFVGQGIGAKVRL